MSEGEGRVLVAGTPPAAGEIDDGGSASRRRLPGWLTRVAGVVAYIAVVIVLWWVVVRAFSISALLFPDPVGVWQAAYQNFPLLAINILITLEEAMLGFALAIVVGVTLAVLMISSKTVSGLIMPALVVINSTPKVVVAPILIIWLGYGVLSKVGMAFLMCAFPIVINATQGLYDVEPELLDLYRLMQASPWAVMWKVRLPNAMPALFSSFKIAMPIALIGAVIGEFVAAKAGIGHQIVLAYSNFKTEFVFAAVIGISMTCVILFELLLLLERRVLSWRPPQST